MTTDACAGRVLKLSHALALMLGISGAALAQTSSPPLSDVNAHVHRNDVVFVVERHAGETRGVFVSASSTSLVVSVDGRTREIPVGDIVYIEKRGDPVWNGAAIGGAILGLGFMGGAGASCSPRCGSEVPTATAVGAALGAAIGATIDYLHVGRTLVYGAHPGPGVATLGNLWSSIKPGDPLTIRLRDERVFDGAFSKASQGALTVDVHGQSREIQAGDVRQISLNRGGNHLKRGLLIGIPAGALSGTGPCYRVDPTPSKISCGSGVIIGMAAGGAIGAFIGSRVWGRTVVYDAPQDGRQSAMQVGVWPLVAAHTASVTVSLTF